MARIRTIKPELPQSESMGRVSRDSRLCFILLWTLSDDEGRLRGNSRMLASLLFPYDDDAPRLIDAWMMELETEGCVVRYQVDGTSYVQITNWVSHQKIDKPTRSKFPPMSEGSRLLSTPRESSSQDQGPEDQGPEELTRGLDQGDDRDHLPAPALPKPVAEKSAPKQPTEFQIVCKATWGAYSDAYSLRYGVDPVRNQKTNSQIQSFCKSIAYDEAPAVASFFVTHNDSFYVRKGHDLGMLLSDAAKLRMEWASGRKMTATKAAQIDRTQTNHDAFAGLMAEADMREGIAP